MPEKALKCSECSFRSVTLKGIKIHRSRQHPALASNILNLSQNFIDCLTPKQIRLLGTQIKRNRRRSAPRRSDHVAGGSVQSSGSNGSSELAPSGHVPNGSRQRSEVFPVGSARSADSAADSFPLAQTGLQEHVGSIEFRGSDSNVPGASQPFLCKVAESSELKSEDEEVESRTYSVQTTSRRNCGRASNAFSGPEIVGNRWTKRTAPSDTVSPRVTSSGQNNCRASPLIRDSGDGSLNPGFPGTFEQSTMRGSRRLKDLWPACIFELISAQPYDDESSSERENFLTLLGNCPVLDYNSSSAWDLVLRCSLCQKPIGGIRNMEAHMGKHFQRAEIRCDISSQAPDLRVQDPRFLGWTEMVPDHSEETRPPSYDSIRAPDETLNQPMTFEMTTE